MFMTLIFLVLGFAMAVAGGFLVVSGLPAEGRYNPQKGEREVLATHLGRIIAGTILVLVGILIGLFSFGWTQVSSGEVGVVSQFGKVQDDEMQPGLQWRPPVITSVSNWDTKVRVYTFDKIEAFTSENQPALLTGIVNYHIVPTAASDLQQTYGSDFEQKLVVSQSDSALKAEARKYGVDAITAKRDELAAAAMAELTASNTNTGVVIDGVSIRNIDLSSDYLSAVEAKQKAQQGVEQAKAEANTAREKAHGVADAQVIEAQGQADANKAITASLTNPLIQWQYVQKLAPNVSVMMIPSGSNFIYPLPSFAP